MRCGLEAPDRFGDAGQRDECDDGIDDAFLAFFLGDVGAGDVHAGTIFPGTIATSVPSPEIAVNRWNEAISETR